MTNPNPLSSAQRELLARGHLAGDVAQKLINSKDFQRRYNEGDPVAIDKFNQLIAHQALGASVKSDVVHGPEMQANETALANVTARIEEMKNNREFVGKYVAGEQSAVKAWNEAFAEHAVAAGIPADVVREGMAPKPAAPQSVDPYQEVNS